MPETPATIRAWADATFGPRTPLRALARAHAEMSELLMELTGPADPARLLSEAADVAITLCTGPWFDEWPEPQSARMQETAILVCAEDIGATFSWLDPTGNSCIKVVESAAAHLASAFPALWPEVERKMTLNRARTWTRDGFGTGQHQKDPTP